MRTAVVVLAAAVGTVLYPPATDAQVTRLTRCQTITNPDSYVLALSVNANGGDCFVVEADFVSIDLNGQVISGDRTPGGVGIRVEGFHFVVRNGTITNFDVGIAATGGLIIIREVQAIGNSSGIFAAPGPDIIVTNSKAVDNDVHGMIFGRGVRAEGNTVTNNANGLLVGGGSRVSDNIATDNAQIGIGVGLADDPGSAVSGNVASGNGIGIQVICPSNVFGNMATGNGTNFDLIGQGCVGADVPPP